MSRQLCQFSEDSPCGLGACTIVVDVDKPPGRCGDCITQLRHTYHHEIKKLDKSRRKFDPSGPSPMANPTSTFTTKPKTKPIPKWAPSPEDEIWGSAEQLQTNVESVQEPTLGTNGKKKSPSRFPPSAVMVDIAKRHLMRLMIDLLSLRGVRVSRPLEII
jgi:hypothetical protein